MIAGRKFQLRGIVILAAAIALTWLASSVTSSALTLSWAGNPANVDGIKIERADSADGPWSQIAIVDPNANNFVDMAVTCGAQYFYRVRAYNSGGDSPYSNVAGPASQVCCTYLLSSSRGHYGSEGANDSVSMTADNSCAWTATPSVPWITISGGSSGSGNGTITFSVAASTSSTTRTGRFTIGGQTFTVIQSGVNPSFVSITNDVDTVGGMPVILAGEPINFNAGTIDNSGNPVTYAWDFGDGATSTDSSPEHTFAECGPYAVTVTAGNGITTTNSTLNVVVPCVLSVTNFHASLKFSRPNQDKCTFKAIPQPSQCTNWLGTTITLDIGGAQFSLTLDAKGRGTSSNATCRFTFNKRTGVCELTAKLSRGTWRDAWAGYGLVNSDTPKSGISVTLPVTLMINDEAFMADKPLRYTAAANKTGLAK